MDIYCKFCHSTIDLQSNPGVYKCDCTKTCVEIGDDHYYVSTSEKDTK